MPLSSTTEICMLVWPALPSEPVLDPSESIAWVIGWNDRSLYIIVAWFLRNCTLQRATVELQKIRSGLQNFHGHLAEMPYRNLNILGCVRPNSTLSSFNANALADEEDIRRARKESYLWLELLEGPVLGELWCCGARVQPCQLHVVRCDPAKVLSTRPSLFSATALYGVSGVRQLQRGIAPICAPGAASNLEGVLLPPVMCKEAEPRVLQRTQPRRPNSSNLNDSIVLAAEDSFLLADRDKAAAERLRNSSISYNPNASLHSEQTFAESLAKETSFSAELDRSHNRRESVTTALDGSAVQSDAELSVAGGNTSNSGGGSGAVRGRVGVNSDSEGEHYGANGSRRGEHSTHSQEDKSLPVSATRTQQPPPPPPPPPPPAGVPPRLDFPSTADRAEMSVFLATMRAGRNVRRMIQKERPHLYVRGDVVEPLTGVLRLVVNFLFIYVAGALRYLRFSKTAEVLLYRVSEFAHFLCVVSFASHACGLHPVLPHQLSTSPEHRYVCIFDYISRCAVDLLLGVVVYLCVSAWGPSLYVASQYLTRYWLYEVHASYMDWFDGYPAGLKVNEDLNMALCFFAKCVLDWWDALLSWSPATLPSLVSFQSTSGVAAAQFNSTISSLPPTSWAYPESEDQLKVIYDWVGTAFHLRIFCLLGCSTAAAFVSDLTGLVSLHLRFLYHAVAFPYRFTRVLLRNLFRQFHGVKYNPLRKRYDAYHFETDQMLAATFLFVIIMFLFPTLAVYYLYFSFVLTTIWAMETCLESIAYLSLHVPVHPILYWLYARHKLSGGVALSHPVITSVRRFPGRGGRPDREEEELASHTVEVTVESMPLPLSTMLTDFYVVLDIMLMRLRPEKVVSLVVRGRMEETPKMADVIGPHLLTDCVAPRCTLCAAPTVSPGAKKK
ncbi:putative N-acetylglucosaminyl transferase component [Leptomonas pyrrhocoris]|uniref:Putative N-acetylglucosaminyl transferase component n=1 Tax=Leptomonas pyrrhocoris TaxID=157538 RepID=A0A0M9G213_LEPPY|nr:putative N-acetylglucosaminyl transferase component [Leptomonas pyrrhocoris]KPA80597.1 putative N-acetylglucosaminyl transferase component [Leptomonas pyrrhocoris]|eukprot:XP_015659036.1 putative N-acetylglucosaminyl transferase component [Leptomonas pyrrhocoris]